MTYTHFSLFQKNSPRFAAYPIIANYYFSSPNGYPRVQAPTTSYASASPSPYNAQSRVSPTTSYHTAPVTSYVTQYSTQLYPRLTPTVRYQYQAPYKPYYGGQYLGQQQPHYYPYHSVGNRPAVSQQSMMPAQVYQAQNTVQFKQEQPVTYIDKSGQYLAPQPLDRFQMPYGQLQYQASQESTTGIVDKSAQYLPPQDKQPYGFKVLIN